MPFDVCRLSGAASPATAHGQNQASAIFSAASPVLHSANYSTLTSPEKVSDADADARAAAVRKVAAPARLSPAFSTFSNKIFMRSPTDFNKLDQSTDKNEFSSFENSSEFNEKKMNVSNGTKMHMTSVRSEKTVENRSFSSSQQQQQTTTVPSFHHP